jgi:hypothetical protein
LRKKGVLREREKIQEREWQRKMEWTEKEEVKVRAVQCSIAKGVCGLRVERREDKLLRKGSQEVEESGK